MEVWKRPQASGLKLEILYLDFDPAPAAGIDLQRLLLMTTPRCHIPLDSPPLMMRKRPSARKSRMRCGPPALCWKCVGPGNAGNAGNAGTGEDCNSEESSSS
ncbi:unnamed protein product [Pleuronectes platessa]|uniref:Uncharacterized protein n=1 Tax=Pleuronectes platessa TaxID=8262 RepID=A0A9N7UC62_PLEPL|nr:unnamed protein product [Pleuronectes platessa]